MTATVETIERTVFVRSFELPLADAWDGRTLDVRIVPYNVPATVADPPHFRPYREMFVPGTFERQLSTPGRDKVWLNVEHDQGWGGAVGRSLEFHDRDDGLHGSFGVDEGPDGDKALRMVTSGFLSGLSLEFRSLASRRVDGIVHRLRAQLDKVSLCRYPAYPGAEVLAVREEPEEPEPELVQLPDLTRTSDVDERLAALGFQPLMRIAQTSKPWDGSASRFTDEQYARSAVLDRGPSVTSVKERYSLPVLEPDGTLNTNALGAAAGRIGQVHAAPAQKATAARKLIRYYNQAGMDVPPGLRQLASSA